MLFADRLEVWNAGRLPRGLTIADLKRAHSSLPPNELLAVPMYLKGAIEKTGTGTEDMVRQCRNWGLPDPEFTDGPDFRIVIRRRISGSGEAPIAKKNVPANVPASNEIEAFLASVGEFPGKGTAFHSERLGRTRRTIKRYAAALSTVVEFRGGTKSGGYYVIET